MDFDHNLKNILKEYTISTDAVDMVFDRLQKDGYDDSNETYDISDNIVSNIWNFFIDNDIKFSTKMLVNIIDTLSLIQITQKNWEPKASDYLIKKVYPKYASKTNMTADEFSDGIIKAYKDGLNDY